MDKQVRELHCCANCNNLEYDHTMRLDNPYCMSSTYRDRGDMMSLIGMNLEVVVCDGWKPIEEE